MNDGRAKHGWPWIVALLIWPAATNFAPIVAQEPVQEPGLMPVVLTIERNGRWPPQNRVAVRGVRIALVKRQSSTTNETPPDEPRSAQVIISDASFDEIMFGKASNMTDARKRLIRLVRAKVESVDQLSSLTDAQKRKLRLAGSGDIQRLMDRVENLRERVQSDFVDEENVDQLRELAQKLSRAGSPLRRQLESGPFGDGSLFAKALKSALSPEQAAEYALGRLSLPAPQRDRLPDLAVPK
jgi:hypothetical protein